MPNQDSNGDKFTTTTYEFHPEIPAHMRMPEKRSFLEFLYDSKTGKVLGRSGLNWGKLFIFYTIFYIVLAALFAICLQGLFATLSDEYPKWQLDRSLIGTNPGVCLRPVSVHSERGSKIEYNLTDSKAIKEWVDDIENFLHPYKQTIKLESGKTREQCNFHQTYNDTDVCDVEVDKWGPCTLDYNYSYNTTAPCVFIKLNRIYKWVPEYYDDPFDLPAEMPPQLVEHIKSLATAEERKQVWVSCTTDEFSNGKVNINHINNIYGFPHYYYPYLNQPGYLSPIVPIQVVTEAKKLASIECRAWAKNINYLKSLRDRQGSIHIEFEISE